MGGLDLACKRVVYSGMKNDATSRRIAQLLIACSGMFEAVGFACPLTK